MTPPFFINTPLRLSFLPRIKVRDKLQQEFVIADWLDSRLQRND